MITKISKKTIFGLIGILFIGMIGFSLAYFAKEKQLDEPNVFTTGKLKLEFKNDENALVLANSYPIADEDGINMNDRYEFMLENTGTLKASYKLKLKEMNDDIDINDLANPSFIKIVLFDENDILLTDILTITDIKDLDYDIYQGIIEPEETHEFYLKMWLSEDAENDQIGKIYSSKLEIEAIQE